MNFLKYFQDCLSFYFQHRSHYLSATKLIVVDGIDLDEALYSIIHSKRLWGNGESASGPGSGRSETALITENLSLAVEKYKIKSLTDIACGDCNWISNDQVNLKQYIGADIVQLIIEQNAERYSEPYRRFINLDITKDVPPKVDLLLRRDLCVHLTNKQITLALKNILASECGFIAISTSPHIGSNMKIPKGASRPVNLEIPPFNLPPPIEYMSDGKDQFSLRRVGLWNRTELLH